MPNVSYSAILKNNYVKMKTYNKNQCQKQIIVHVILIKTT